MAKSLGVHHSLVASWKAGKGITLRHFEALLREAGGDIEKAMPWAPENKANAAIMEELDAKDARIEELLKTMEGIGGMVSGVAGEPSVGRGEGRRRRKSA